MKIHTEITPELSEFISRQHLFFVASAPLTLWGIFEKLHIQPISIGETP